MKKYAFLVYHKEYIDFLKGIQDIGVLHVIEKESGEIEEEEIHIKYEQLSKLNDALKFLSKRNVEKAEEKEEKRSGEEILTELTKLRTDLEDYTQRLAHLNKEKQVAEPWGEFSWETIDKLKEAGYHLDFFLCLSRDFDPQWEDIYNLSIINELNGQTYFVIVRNSEETIELDAEKAVLPKTSVSKLYKQIEEIENILQKTEQRFDHIAKSGIKKLEQHKNSLKADLDFNNVVLNTHKEAENKLMLLEGWVPKETEEELNTYLNKSGVYFETENAIPQDKPPIKLKNNKFARLYEPVGELYTMPDYKEIDLTPFFAPFFMMFFGFCLGDVGYGLVILLATLLLRSKVKSSMRPLLSLGSYLGAATIIMGFISGTIFGENMLEWSAPWMKIPQRIMLNTDQLMMLSFAVGGVQTIFGMFIKAANQAKQFGFAYALSTLGWIWVILGGVILYGLKEAEMIGAAQFKLYFIIVAGIGSIFIFFMNSPGKNIFLNFGLGIWDTYGMASGLLGDLLSYVRLFALGISSAVLGNVFNQLAFSLSPDVPVAGQLVTILILLFGHGLNFFMSALGSFVHPLRLTFVEFYKNAGFAGGGRKYEPFK
ncbi:MAG: hypothetical protein JW801_01215, partial [Bacteroidales bacterium]|nr:hypothetical protein [Bacteroidales bacterium]